MYGICGCVYVCIFLAGALCGGTFLLPERGGHRTSEAQVAHRVPAYPRQLLHRDASVRKYVNGPTCLNDFSFFFGFLPFLAPKVHTTRHPLTRMPIAFGTVEMSRIQKAVYK